MKKLYPALFSKKVLSIVVFLVFSIASLKAQTTITTLPNPPYNGGNSLGSPSNISFVVQNNNGFPINITAISNWCTTADNTSIWQLYVNPTTLSGAETDVTAAPWQLIATSLATPVAATGITPLNFQGLSYTMPAGAEYRFVLRNTGPGSTRYSGTGSAIAPNSFTDGGVTLKLGDLQIAGANVGYSGSGTSLTLTPRYFTGAITFAPAGPCTDPPVTGTVTSTANPVCLGVNFTLGLDGGTGGTGQTYQWQISTDNVSWNNIPGATLATLTTSQTSSNYYRAQVTCGTTTSTSGSLQVLTPAAVSGTFTINSALPTGGTNFQSFNAAYDYIKCGIAGPVVFNVDPASGPYTEQLIMEEVPGASATNTVTFNGNGRTIQFLSTNTNERAVIKLNGADHITFDSLVITALANATTEYGFGVQLLNDADSNTVRRCIINVTDGFTSTNHVGISISNSATSATATGAASCDYNLFELNTVNGGYYGITNVGSNTVANQFNSFLNNTLQNFYLYGFYTNGSFGTTIDGNDISRPTRTVISTGTSNAIYFTSLSTQARVNANRIHNMLGGNTASTNDVVGIYFTSVDAFAGLENVVSNNAIYDIRSNGSITALYNAGSDNIFYYHNTISLDDASSTTTETTRGFYQTTTAGGIDLKNNLITLRRGGTGIMTGLFFNTATSTITSNYNNIFYTPAANTFYGSSGGTGQPTLNAWQSATTQDANSQFIDPLYVDANAGNLLPLAPGLNDLGTPVAQVTTDILGAARSVTTPDIGAWEFSVPACTAPPTPGDATSSAAGALCPNELVSLGLINNSYGLNQTYQWESATSLAGPWSGISPVQTTPGFNINPTVTLYYRAAVTCSGQTAYSTPVQVFVNDLFPAGTYTIDRNNPTTWPGAGVGSNFNSFNAAYDALRCGIAGPVIFNVVPGTGPYNEQLIMGEIQGTSGTNTVTFNGNGNVITFLSTNTDERAVIKFNGTDHFIFDSLVVEATGTLTTEYGYGFHFTNDADSNIIRNNTININTSSTSTNYAGIVMSAGTTPTTTGTTHCDYNLIDNNTVNGGYYGITLVGSTTEAVANNVVTNNTIRDFYFYGMYIYGNFSTLVEHNDLSRPTRTNTGSTGYGIYMTSLSVSLKISKNRIHNFFDAMPTSTSTFAGIYSTGVDAFAGLENVISNNAIYNVNNNGTQYGIYNSSSDNTWYYHNSIALDDAASTTTSTTNGFYQTTTAGGIELKNNNISITRGGTGLKYCFNFNTATTNWISDYNNLHRDAQNANVGRYNAVNHATIADWRTATTQDANSLSTDPFFTDASAGNLAPRSPGLDNKGTPIASITTDILDAARSATTPDIGAWEFTVPDCVAPPTAGTATAFPNVNICLGTPIDLALTGNSFGAGQTYQWQYSTSAAGPWTNLGDPMQFPDTTILAAGTLYYQAIVTCSGQSVASSSVLVNMNPPFPSGVYTINNTQPTTWPGAGVGSNFNSFVEAVAVMDCGIDGPVTFNVAAGTYTEQVRMHAITGTGPNSRVTFQSASGDPTSVILTFGSTGTAANYTLMLDSASYITYRNMTINATDATYARAVSIFNTASYDSINNVVINVPAVTATTQNAVGIYGDDMTGNDNVLQGNIIAGGNSGIYLGALSTAAPTQYNVIDSNVVTGSYQYGIYASTNYFVTVKNNTVDVTDPRSTTSYGIYLTNCDSAFQVNRNHITISNTSTTTYGLYMTGCAAAESERGSVSNNKVIALVGNTGTLYGIYQSATQSADAFNNVSNVSTTATSSYGLYSTGGTGGIRYYNNSIQNSSAAVSTTNIAAYFSHSSSAAGQVNIRNNVFTHANNGIAMYQGNVSNIYSDYNMLYTAGATLVRQGSTNFATLQDWRNTHNWDYSSIVYAPAFAAGTDLVPDAANPDSWAMHGRGVQIEGNDADYNGAPRPTTLTTGVPDLGAYEFLPTVDPPALPSTPGAPAAGTTQVFMFGTDTVQKISWAPGSTVPTSVDVRRYSGIIPPGLASGQASMYFYTDVDGTGSAPTNFTMQQFYIDSWMRDIPSEPTVKLGRTDAAAAWFVSSSSAVDFFGNSITESNLSFLDKFTGMTDGVAPVPDLPPLTTLDTSNRGRRFWVAYGHHYGFSSNSQDMVLYLSAEDSANVTVKVKGTNWIRHYAIPANTVRVSDLMPKSGLIDARLVDEGFFEKGISIESDVPIVAYAHIYDGANSGAGMLLPTGVYGYEYQSLNSSQYYPSGGAGSYSWFYVIADRDSTLVEITPAVDSKGGRPAGVPFTVYLNRGDVYNVMGTQTGGAGTDMTGSLIKSIPNASGKCYPIAVFSGSSRTAICNTTNGDNMIQQVFPSQAWGTRYLTFATANSTSSTNYNSNLFRVMVKDPTTVVSLNGVVIPQAQLVIPGNYYQFSTTQGNGANGSIYVEADKPVLVSQYMVSTSANQCPGVTATGNGDPEMIYISPVEQGIKKAVFYNTNESAITSNYINVVIPNGGMSTLTIDGATTFTDVFPHPFQAGYTCVRHNLGGAAAQHIIESDSAFTAITYGLGSVESYGYNAGTLVKNLSATPSFNNIFSNTNTSSYTCVGTPFRFNLNISVKPTQLIWSFSEINNMTPNTDVTEVSPVPVDSTLVNGKWIYRYSVNIDFEFTATGNYLLPIQIFHPSIEGCDGSYEVLLPISVIAAPVTDFSTAFTGCLGDMVQFTGESTTANGVPTSTWNWNFGDNNTASVQNPSHTYAAAGTYDVQLQAIADDGCVGDTTRQVVVNERPLVAVVNDTVYVCLNGSATFEILNPVAGATYSWYSAPTGGTLLGTGVTFVANNITAVTDFYVEGIVGGCSSLDRTRVTAAILPDLPAPVVTVDSIGTNILVFEWSPVAGATSYEVSTNGGGTWSVPSSGPTGLSHTVTNLPLGTTVTLLVRANGGCTPAESQPVSATTRTDQVFIPNAFTPNGDGLNDQLRVYSNVIRQMRFVVFNQWGEKIFESFDQNNAWDGTHKGKPQPSGVYMYVCDITLNTGERIQRKGAINLVR